MTRQYSAAWLCGLSAGAALMYLLDPAEGRRRRALIGDKTRRLASQASEVSGTWSREVRDRWPGLKARLSNGSPTTRALAGAGALAGVTLAMVAASRARRGAARDLEMVDNWDPAGFA